MKVTPEVLSALDYLYNAREMQTIRRWLRNAAADEMTRAIKTDEDVDVNRGRARALMELAEIFETAPQQRERLEKRNGSSKPGEAGDPYRRI